MIDIISSVTLNNMDICFFGYDYTLDIAARLLEDGHRICHIFTFPCDNQFAYNKQTHEFATYHRIPIAEEKVSKKDIERLIDNNCTLFLSCGYPYKIPDIPDRNDAYGLNLHPTLLPRGRGIMPLPYIIMQEPTAAGFTIHKLAEDFDCGDILYQEPITVDEHTDIETLSARIALQCPDAVAEVVNHLKDYRAKAIKQNSAQASFYHSPGERARTISWDSNVESLLTMGRAFGRFGVMATVHNDFGQSQKLAIFQFSGWTEKHPHPCGKLMRSSPREIIVAVGDGFLCLKEFQVLANT